MPKHKQGSGSIYKRGKVWWLSYYANGKHICESSHTTERGQARLLLQQRLGQIAEGRYVLATVDRILIDELAEDMLTDYRINAKKSLKDAERTVKALGRFFGGKKAQSVVAADIAAYVA